MQRQPLQSDHGSSIFYFAAVQHGAGFKKWHDLDQNILSFRLEAEHASRGGRIDSAEKKRTGLRHRTRAQEESVDWDRVSNLESCFLNRLAAHDHVWRFAFFDDSRHRLPAPGMVAGNVGAGTELADQHDLVPPRIVGQHGCRVAALEDLAADDGTLPASEQAVAEEIATNPEVALEGRDMLDQFDLFVGRGRRQGQGAYSTGKKGPFSCENDPDWLRR